MENLLPDVEYAHTLPSAVENLLPDVEYAHVPRSRESDRLVKRKFTDDMDRSHVTLVRHLVETNVKT